MYKWKNIYGGHGQVDPRWLLTRTVAGLGIGTALWLVGSYINRWIGGPAPKSASRDWKSAEEKKFINENIGVIEVSIRETDQKKKKV